MGWIWLLCASFFEVAFTTTLRLSDSFRNLGAVAALVVCIGLSLFFLELAERSIPLGTAYAVWTSIGAVGTVLIGIIFYREPATLVRALLICGIVVCAIGLKVTGAAES